MRRIRNRLKQWLGREFLGHWALAFSFAVGALSAIIALLPKVEFNLRRSALILVSCAILAFVYALSKVRKIHLPVPELAPPGLSPGQFMSVETQCDRSLLLQVHELAEVIYGSVPTIPFERYEQWLMINGNILACLLDNCRRVVGYFDVLPLREDFADFLVRGEVGEQDIRREHILPPEAARNCKQLYLAGFAVAEPGTTAGGRHASYLLWALRRYLEFYYCPVNDKQLFAEAATREGEQILRRYNFQLVQAGRSRRDGFPVYAASLSPRLFNAMAAIPDWSGACRLSWESSSTQTSQTQGGSSEP